MKSYWSNWDLSRVFRLVLGLFIVFQGIWSSEWTFILLGGLFSLMPLFNIGCCASGRCSMPAKHKETSPAEDIRYEEVK